MPDFPDNTLASWNFCEPPGAPRRSSGRTPCILQEYNGPIARAFDPRVGSYAWIRPGQCFIARHDACPQLNLHGRVSLGILALIRPRVAHAWQFIAGKWDERGKRQYGLFIGAERRTLDPAWERRPIDGLHVSGYVSGVGGNTPGHEACVTYATGSTSLRTDQWRSVAMTYDRADIRVYVDGELDTWNGSNPFPLDSPDIFSGNGDFTVGHRAYHAWPDFPVAPPPPDTGFGGDIAFLAVFDRAPGPDEIRILSHRILHD